MDINPYANALHNYSQMFNANLQNPTVTTPNMQQPRRISSASPFGQILDNVTKYLQPMDAFSNKMPYSTFAAPFHEVANQFVQNTVRPQFEQYTLNPFKQQQAAQAAAGNMQYARGGQNYMNNALNQVMQQSFYPQQLQVQQSLENIARQLYNQQGQQYYTGPTAFNNIGMY